jgi:CRISPR/Cas system-associated exonuclease Cas4 (RecB family)
MIERNLELPKKDKNGKSRLSYSQIKCFKDNKQEFINRYILNEPFVSNAYIDFGSKVGEALETNNFNNFHELEEDILKKVERLDEFEKFVNLDFGGFVMYGYIDTVSKDLNKIIDYKTGGKKKELTYTKEDYTQLCYYALALKQEYGITPKEAQVHFIRRSGNLYRNQPLVVAQEDPIIIDIDITEERLKQVYWETIKVAEDIESFYLEYKKSNG